MNARTSVVPCWQLGCCLVFRSSTWGRHVQLHNAVTNEQEDDLEHVGLTCSSHSQRQPARRNGAGVQAWGTSSASSPWIHLTCYSNEVRGRCRLMYLLWTWFSFADVCFWWTGRFAYISLVLAWGLSVAGNCYLSRTSAICCTFPMVGETKLSKSWRPYRPSTNTGWTPQISWELEDPQDL